jgi:predicted nucleotidyltransferase
MGKDAVIQALQRHQQELNAAGIVHLRLFGSVARYTRHRQLAAPSI